MKSSDDAPTSPPASNATVARDTDSDREARSINAGTTLSEATGLYRLLIDSARDYAIFALDVTGRVLSWNTGAEYLKGYTRDEIVGRNFSIFYPPEDIATGKPQRELVDAQRDGSIEDEGWRVRKDGSCFWANVTITAIRDGSGTLVGFAKVTRDLTERRRAENQLRASEERFRVLVQGVQDYAIFMLDPDGRVSSWNDGARRIKGYAPEEIIGRHFSTFYPAVDVAAGKPAWELVTASRDGKYEEEGWRVRKDGTSFWANVLITAIRGDNGSLIGFAKVTRDLTERKAAQERTLADARRIAEAEAASRTKSEFLTSLSHELRTPINATMGYAELLGMEVGGSLTPKQHEYLDRLRGSQEHLLRIITDLLNYGRMEARQLHYNIMTVALQSVVETVLPMVQPQAVGKALTVEHTPCPPGLTARADRVKFEQILLNLVSNAVKFTPAGGRVTVSCEQRGEWAVIAVTDTGPGVPAEKQSAIFEPFVQLGRSLTSGHEGTGLGLSISRDLARAMGGDVVVASEAGRGATFTVTLPRG
jgi:PAS domain S-box-containing protein